MAEPEEAEQDACEVLDYLNDLIDEALEPELSREEVILKLREMQEYLAQFEVDSQ